MLNKPIPVLSLLVIATILFSFQEAEAQSTIDVTPNGSRYYMDGTELMKADLAHLYSGTDSWELWLKSQRDRRTSNALSVFGGFGIGWYLGNSLNSNRNFNPNARKNARTMGLLGIGFTVLTIPLIASSKRSKRKAAGLYNRNLQSDSSSSGYWQFDSSARNLGLSYHF